MSESQGLYQRKNDSRVFL